MVAKWAGRSTVFTFEGGAIDQVRSFAAFGSSRAQIDASVYGESWTSTVLGLQDGDEVAAVFAFDATSTTQQDIIDAYNTAPDTPVVFNATHDDAGMSYDIHAILTAVAWDPPLDGLLALNVTLKIVNPGVVEGT